MTVQKRSIVKFGVVLCMSIIILTFPLVLCKADVDTAIDPEQLRIGSIEITGNVSITRAQVVAQTRARVGQFFNIASANEDVRRIGKIEGVASAYYNTQLVNNEIKLTFVIVEKNLVRAIVLSGNEKLSDSILTKELGFRKGDYLDLFAAKRGVEAFGELYLKKGFPKAEITLDESRLDLGEVAYTIEEGPRVKVKKVSFEGNKALASKELAKVIKTKKRKFLFWSFYYNPTLIEQDIVKLQEIMQKRAFLDATVKSQTEFSQDGTEAYVTFIIDEGPIYVVDQIIIKGNTFFQTDQILSDLKLREGWYYSRERAEFDTKKILGMYREQGFVDAAVEHRRSFVGIDHVIVEFEIDEGKRFRIGDIIVTGNQSVQDKVVRRILDEEGFQPGQWYNADAARGDGQGELEKDLQRSVYAQSVFIQPSGDVPGQKNAQVNVNEGQTGSIMFGAGVASNTGLMGQISYDQRNFDINDKPESFEELLTGKAFKGAGQYFRILLEPGLEQSRFSVSFTEPYLYDQPISLNTVASSFEREWEAYDEQRLRGYLGFEKRYEDKWRRGIGVRVENIDVSDIEPDAPKEIKDDSGWNTLFGTRFYLRKDTTDSRFLPSKGYNFEIGYEQVGGDHTFGVVDATQRWYTTLYEDLAERKTILETKVHGASIIGDAPVFEKFYAGGSGSIRGFDYRGVSTRGVSTLNPAIRDDPIGSDWIVTGNAEVAVPLNSEVLSALFFVDAGAIDTGGVRSSVGIGIQVMLPQWFGPVPMRFELAAPITKEDEDETQAFSFSVGALF